LRASVKTAPYLERDPGEKHKREHDMKSPSDFELSRRKLLAGSAASMALTAAPSILNAQAPAVEAAVAEVSAVWKVSFTVNGTARGLTLDPRTTLLDALREHLHLTGTKKGLRSRPVRRLHRHRWRKADQFLHDARRDA
jgi:hypothetical protein